MKSNEDRVLGVFFGNPTEKFHIREIARITGLNPNTILNITIGLEKEKLLKREKKRHVVEVFANVSERFKQLKRMSNLKKIYESGILDILINHYSPEAISLVGSCSSGEDVNKSDVDIVVISRKKEIMSLSRFEKVFGREVHLIVTDYGNISNEFYTNLINGIVLYGSIRKK